MDFDSPDPDVEKEFPGLYGSDSVGSRKREEEDCKNLVYNWLIVLLFTMLNTHDIFQIFFFKSAKATTKKWAKKKFCWDDVKTKRIRRTKGTLHWMVKAHQKRN